MSETFHAGDLLDSLIELEKTGHAFYGEAAEKTRDEKAAELFRFLACEEAKHEKLYTDLAAEFRKTAPSEGPIGADYEAYLKALVTRNFRFGPADFDSLEAALRFAMSLEKDTLIYVGEIRNILGNQKAELFDTIRNEERKHLRMLTEYRN